VPYRPLQLHAWIPCLVLRAAATYADGVIVLTTGTDAKSLTVTGDGADISVAVGGHTIRLSVPDDGIPCGVVIDAGPNGVRVNESDPERTSELPGQPVPQVFGFRTGLTAPQAAGMTVSVKIGEPFTTTPSALKTAVIVAQLTAAAAAMWVLPRTARWRRPDRWRWRRVSWIDGVVVGVLVVWAVIGPLAVDDGWATMIARQVTATGNPGNYYRWWNAAEVPFALCQELLAPLTAISLAPLWLRTPSTVLAIATWWVLTRGVLHAALPGIAATARVRALAATCLLAAWLPFNLGTRPESYVALGVTSVLALAM
jgi:arabinosyltransferase B